MAEWLKRLSRTRAAREVLGFGIARYLRLVQQTNSWLMEPADAYHHAGRHRRDL